MNLWNYTKAEVTSQNTKCASVSDCKCCIISGSGHWSNQGVFWGMYQEDTSVVVRERCLLSSPDFNHLPKFVQEFTKCSLSYTHKHILGPSAHNPSKSLKCSMHTSRSQRGVLSIIPLGRRNSLKARRNKLFYPAWRRRCSGVNMEQRWKITFKVYWHFKSVQTFYIQC